MSARVEKNRRERRAQRRRRLTISFVAALLLHLLLAAFGGRSFLVPLASNEEAKEELLEITDLEITDFVPEEETPDSVVKDAKAYSEKSYATDQNKVKRGTYGAPPSSALFSPPPSPQTEDQTQASEEGDDALPVDRELAGLISEAIRANLREVYIRPDNRRPGNDGDYRGTADENDFSVMRPQDKYISYMQKFRSRVQNTWRPNRVFAPNLQTNRDIYTVLLVEVRRDGGVGSVEVSQSPGVRAFDIEAVRSVRDAAPYSPFPPSWGDQPSFTFSFGFRIIGDGPI